MASNERNVGKLYRHFLALLGASSQAVYSKLEATVQQYGGLIWAIDALQPEGDGTLLYVLYEVLSGKPVVALQSQHVSEEVLDYDDQLRQNMRQDLGGLPAAPEHLTDELAQDKPGPKDTPPPF